MIGMQIPVVKLTASPDARLRDQGRTGSAVSVVQTLRRDSVRDLSREGSVELNPNVLRASRVSVP